MATNILSEIVAAKRQRVTAAMQATPQEQLREQALPLRSHATPYALASAVDFASRINIIAEFKRRSPSKGVIRADADPVTIAREYESGGAIAISVLTEEDYFAGSLDDLRAVRQAVALPVLRKDFIFDEYQVWESAAAGADALLLIVASLSDSELKALREITEDELGMNALVEVHTKDELRRAQAAGAKLIGVNNRNLHTFEVTLDTSVALALEAPEDVLLVSESGLHSAEDLRRLAACGFSGFLIGETLMRALEPESALRALLSESSSQ